MNSSSSPAAASSAVANATALEAIAREFFLIQGAVWPPLSGYATAAAADRFTVNQVPSASPPTTDVSASPPPPLSTSLRPSSPTPSTTEGRLTRTEPVPTAATPGLRANARAYMRQGKAPKAGSARPASSPRASMTLALTSPLTLPDAGPFFDGYSSPSSPTYTAGSATATAARTTPVSRQPFVARGAGGETRVSRTLGATSPVVGTPPRSTTTTGRTTVLYVPGRSPATASTGAWPSRTGHTYVERVSPSLSALSIPPLGAVGADGELTSSGVPSPIPPPPPPSATEAEPSSQRGGQPLVSTRHLEDDHARFFEPHVLPLLLHLQLLESCSEVRQRQLALFCRWRRAQTDAAGLDDMDAHDALMTTSWMASGHMRRTHPDAPSSADAAAPPLTGADMRGDGGEKLSPGRLDHNDDGDDVDSENWVARYRPWQPLYAAPTKTPGPRRATERDAVADRREGGTAAASTRWTGCANAERQRFYTATPCAYANYVQPPSTYVQACMERVPRLCQKGLEAIRDLVTEANERRRRQDQQQEGDPPPHRRSDQQGLDDTPEGVAENTPREPHYDSLADRPGSARAGGQLSQRSTPQPPLPPSRSGLQARTPPTSSARPSVTSSPADRCLLDTAHASASVVVTHTPAHATGLDGVLRSGHLQPTASMGLHGATDIGAATAHSMTGALLPHQNPVLSVFNWMFRSLVERGDVALAILVLMECAQSGLISANERLSLGAARLRACLPTTLLPVAALALDAFVSLLCFESCDLTYSTEVVEEMLECAWSWVQTGVGYAEVLSGLAVLHHLVTHRHFVPAYDAALAPEKARLRPLMLVVWQRLRQVADDTESSLLFLAGHPARRQQLANLAAATLQVLFVLAFEQRDVVALQNLVAHGVNTLVAAPTLPRRCQYTAHARQTGSQDRPSATAPFPRSASPVPSAVPEYVHDPLHVRSSTESEPHRDSVRADLLPMPSPPPTLSPTPQRPHSQPAVDVAPRQGSGARPPRARSHSLWGRLRHAVKDALGWSSTPQTGQRHHTASQPPPAARHTRGDRAPPPSTEGHGDANAGIVQPPRARSADAAGSAQADLTARRARMPRPAPILIDDLPAVNYGFSRASLVTAAAAATAGSQQALLAPSGPEEAAAQRDVGGQAPTEAANTPPVAPHTITSPEAAPQGPVEFARTVMEPRYQSTTADGAVMLGSLVVGAFLCAWRAAGQETWPLFSDTEAMTSAAGGGAPPNVVEPKRSVAAVRWPNGRQLRVPLVSCTDSAAQEMAQYLLSSLPGSPGPRGSVSVNSPSFATAGLGDVSGGSTDYRGMGSSAHYAAHRSTPLLSTSGFAASPRPQHATARGGHPATALSHAVWLHSAGVRQLSTEALFILPDVLRAPHARSASPRADALADDRVATASTMAGRQRASLARAADPEWRSFETERSNSYYIVGRGGSRPPPPSAATATDGTDAHAPSTHGGEAHTHGQTSEPTTPGAVLPEGRLPWLSFFLPFEAVVTVFEQYLEQAHRHASLPPTASAPPSSQRPRQSSARTDNDDDGDAPASSHATSASPSLEALLCVERLLPLLSQPYCALLDAELVVRATQRMVNRATQLMKERAAAIDEGPKDDVTGGAVRVATAPHVADAEALIMPNRLALHSLCLLLASTARGFPAVFEDTFQHKLFPLLSHALRHDSRAYDPLALPALSLLVHNIPSPRTGLHLAPCVRRLSHMASTHGARFDLRVVCSVSVINCVYTELRLDTQDTHLKLVCDTLLEPDEAEDAELRSLDQAANVNDDNRAEVVSLRAELAAYAFELRQRKRLCFHFFSLFKFYLRRAAVVMAEVCVPYLTHRDPVLRLGAVNASAELLIPRNPTTDGLAPTAAMTHVGVPPDIAQDPRPQHTGAGGDRTVWTAPTTAAPPCSPFIFSPTVALAGSVQSILLHNAVNAFPTQTMWAGGAPPHMPYMFTTAPLMDAAEAEVPGTAASLGSFGSPSLDAYSGAEKLAGPLSDEAATAWMDAVEARDAFQSLRDVRRHEEATAARSHALILGTGRQAYGRTHSYFLRICLQRLMDVATSDPEKLVRYHALQVFLLPSTHFYIYPYEAMLQSLLVALNDAYWPNRVLALNVLRRVAPLNPSMVYPRLRKVLLRELNGVPCVDAHPCEQQQACRTNDGSAGDCDVCAGGSVSLGHGAAYSTAAGSGVAALGGTGSGGTHARQYRRGQEAAAQRDVSDMVGRRATALARPDQQAANLFFLSELILALSKSIPLYLRRILELPRRVLCAPPRAGPENRMALHSALRLLRLLNEYSTPAERHLLDPFVQLVSALLGRWDTDAHLTVAVLATLQSILQSTETTLHAHCHLENVAAALHALLYQKPTIGADLSVAVLRLLGTISSIEPSQRADDELGLFASSSGRESALLRRPQDRLTLPSLTVYLGAHAASREFVVPPTMEVALETHAQPDAFNTFKQPAWPDVVLRVLMKAISDYASRTIHFTPEGLSTCVDTIVKVLCETEAVFHLELYMPTVLSVVLALTNAAATGDGGGGADSCDGLAADGSQQPASTAHTGPHPPVAVTKLVEESRAAGLAAGDRHKEQGKAHHHHRSHHPAAAHSAVNGQPAGITTADTVGRSGHATAPTHGRLRNHHDHDSGERSTDRGGVGSNGAGATAPLLNGPYTLPGHDPSIRLLNLRTTSAAASVIHANTLVSLRLLVQRVGSAISPMFPLLQLFLVCGWEPDRRDRVQHSCELLHTLCVTVPDLVQPTADVWLSRLITATLALHRLVAAERSAVRARQPKASQRSDSAPSYGHRVTGPTPAAPATPLSGDAEQFLRSAHTPGFIRDASDSDSNDSLGDAEGTSEAAGEGNRIPTTTEAWERLEEWAVGLQAVYDTVAMTMLALQPLASSTCRENVCALLAHDVLLSSDVPMANTSTSRSPCLVRLLPRLGAPAPTDHPRTAATHAGHADDTVQVSVLDLTTSGVESVIAFVNRVFARVLLTFLRACDTSTVTTAVAKGCMGCLRLLAEAHTTALQQIERVPDACFPAELRTASRSVDQDAPRSLATDANTEAFAQRVRLERKLLWFRHECTATTLSVAPPARLTPTSAWFADSLLICVHFTSTDDHSSVERYFPFNGVTTSWESTAEMDLLACLVYVASRSSHNAVSYNVMLEEYTHDRFGGIESPVTAFLRCTSSRFYRCRLLTVLTLTEGKLGSIITHPTQVTWLRHTAPSHPSDPLTAQHTTPPPATASTSTLAHYAHDGNDDNDVEANTNSNNNNNNSDGDPTGEAEDSKGWSTGQRDGSSTLTQQSSQAFSTHLASGSSATVVAWTDATKPMTGSEAGAGQVGHGGLTTPSSQAPLTGLNHAVAPGSQTSSLASPCSATATGAVGPTTRTLSQHHQHFHAARGFVSPVSRDGLDQMAHAPVRYADSGTPRSLLVDTSNSLATAPIPMPRLWASTSTPLLVPGGGAAGSTTESSVAVDDGSTPLCGGQASGTVHGAPGGVSLRADNAALRTEAHRGWPPHQTRAGGSHGMSSASSSPLLAGSGAALPTCVRCPSDNGADAATSDALWPSRRLSGSGQHRRGSSAVMSHDGVPEGGAHAPSSSTAVAATATTMVNPAGHLVTRPVALGSSVRNTRSWMGVGSFRMSPLLAGPPTPTAPATPHVGSGTDRSVSSPLAPHPADNPGKATLSPTTLAVSGALATDADVPIPTAVAVGHRWRGVPRPPSLLSMGTPPAGTASSSPSLEPAPARRAVPPMMMDAHGLKEGSGVGLGDIPATAVGGEHSDPPCAPCADGDGDAAADDAHTHSTPSEFSASAQAGGGSGGERHVNTLVEAFKQHRLLSRLSDAAQWQEWFLSWCVRCVCSSEEPCVVACVPLVRFHKPDLVYSDILAVALLSNLLTFTTEDVVDMMAALHDFVDAHADFVPFVVSRELARLAHMIRLHGPYLFPDWLWQAAVETHLSPAFVADLADRALQPQQALLYWFAEMQRTLHWDTVVRLFSTLSDTHAQHEQTWAAYDPALIKALPTLLHELTEGQATASCEPVATQPDSSPVTVRLPQPMQEVLGSYYAAARGYEASAHRVCGQVVPPPVLSAASDNAQSETFAMTLTPSVPRLGACGVLPDDRDAVMPLASLSAQAWASVLPWASSAARCYMRIFDFEAVLRLWHIWCEPAVRPARLFHTRRQSATTASGSGPSSRSGSPPMSPVDAVTTLAARADGLPQTTQPATAVSSLNRASAPFCPPQSSVDESGVCTAGSPVAIPTGFPKRLCVGASADTTTAPPPPACLATIASYVTVAAHALSRWDVVMDASDTASFLLATPAGLSDPLLASRQAKGAGGSTLAPPCATDHTMDEHYTNNLRRQVIAARVAALTAAGRYEEAKTALGSLQHAVAEAYPLLQTENARLRVEVSGLVQQVADLDEGIRAVELSTHGEHLHKGDDGAADESSPYDGRDAARLGADGVDMRSVDLAHEVNGKLYRETTIYRLRNIASRPLPGDTTVLQQFVSIATRSALTPPHWQQRNVCVLCEQIEYEGLPMRAVLAMHHFQGMPSRSLQVADMTRYRNALTIENCRRLIRNFTEPAHLHVLYDSISSILRVDLLRTQSAALLAASSHADGGAPAALTAALQHTMQSILQSVNVGGNGSHAMLSVSELGQQPLTPFQVNLLLLNVACRRRLKHVLSLHTSNPAHASAPQAAPRESTPPHSPLMPMSPVTAYALSRHWAARDGGAVHTSGAGPLTDVDVSPVTVSTFSTWSHPRGRRWGGATTTASTTVEAEPIHGTHTEFPSVCSVSPSSCDTRSRASSPGSVRGGGSAPAGEGPPASMAALRDGHMELTADDALLREYYLLEHAIAVTKLVPSVWREFSHLLFDVCVAMLEEWKETRDPETLVNFSLQSTKAISALQRAGVMWKSGALQAQGGFGPFSTTSLRRRRHARSSLPATHLTIKALYLACQCEAHAEAIKAARVELRMAAHRDTHIRPPSGTGVPPIAEGPERESVATAEEAHGFAALDFDTGAALAQWAAVAPVLMAAALQHPALLDAVESMCARSSMFLEQVVYLVLSSCEHPYTMLFAQESAREEETASSAGARGAQTAGVHARTDSLGVRRVASLEDFADGPRGASDERREAGRGSSTTAAALRTAVSMSSLGDGDAAPTVRPTAAADGSGPSSRASTPLSAPPGVLKRTGRPFAHPFTKSSAEGSAVDLTDAAEPASPLPSRAVTPAGDSDAPLTSSAGPLRAMRRPHSTVSFCTPEEEEALPVHTATFHRHAGEEGAEEGEGHGRGDHDERPEERDHLPRMISVPSQLQNSFSITPATTRLPTERSPTAATAVTISPGASTSASFHRTNSLSRVSAHSGSVRGCARAHHHHHQHGKASPLDRATPFQSEIVQRLAMRSSQHASTLLETLRFRDFAQGTSGASVGVPTGQSTKGPSARLCDEASPPAAPPLELSLTLHRCTFPRPLWALPGAFPVEEPMELAVGNQPPRHQPTTGSTHSMESTSAKSRRAASRSRSRGRTWMRHARSGSISSAAGDDEHLFVSQDEAGTHADVPLGNRKGASTRARREESGSRTDTAATALPAVCFAKRHLTSSSASSTSSGAEETIQVMMTNGHHIWFHHARGPETAWPPGVQAYSDGTRTTSDKMTATSSRSDVGSPRSAAVSVEADRAPPAGSDVRTREAGTLLLPSTLMESSVSFVLAHMPLTWLRRPLVLPLGIQAHLTLLPHRSAHSATTLVQQLPASLLGRTSATASLNATSSWDLMKAFVNHPASARSFTSLKQEWEQHLCTEQAAEATTTTLRTMSSADDASLTKPDGASVSLDGTSVSSAAPASAEDTLMCVLCSHNQFDAHLATAFDTGDTKPLLSALRRLLTGCPPYRVWSAMPQAEAMQALYFYHSHLPRPVAYLEQLEKDVRAVEDSFHERLTRAQSRCAAVGTSDAPLPSRPAGSAGGSDDGGMPSGLPDRPAFRSRVRGHVDGGVRRRAAAAAAAAAGIAPISLLLDTESLSSDAVSAQEALNAVMAERLREMQRVLRRSEATRYRQALHHSFLSGSADTSAWLDTQRTYTQELAEWSVLCFMLNIQQRELGNFFVDTTNGRFTTHRLGPYTLRPLPTATSAVPTLATAPPVTATTESTPLPSFFATPTPPPAHTLAARLLASPFPNVDPSLCRLTEVMLTALPARTPYSTFQSCAATCLFSLYDFVRDLTGVSALGLDSMRPFAATSARGEDGMLGAAPSWGVAALAEQARCQPCFDSSSLQLKLTFDAPLVRLPDAENASRQVVLAMIANTTRRNDKEADTIRRTLRTAFHPTASAEAEEAAEAPPPADSPSHDEPAESATETATPPLAAEPEQTAATAPNDATGSAYVLVSQLIAVATCEENWIGSSTTPHSWQRWAPQW